MHTVGPGIWRENWKSRKMINTHFRTWNIARKTEKCGKFWNVRCRTWNMARKLKIMENGKHPLDDLKNDEITANVKNEKSHCRSWNTARKLKMWIMRNTHFRMWNMARKTEMGGTFRNVHCRPWNMASKLKVMENEKHTLDDLKNDEITENREKWDMYTAGPGICRENWKGGSWEIHTLGREILRGKLKSVENLEMSTVGHGILQDNWR